MSSLRKEATDFTLLPLTKQSGEFEEMVARKAKPWFVFSVWKAIIELESCKKPTTAELIAESMKKMREMRLFHNDLALAVDDRLIERKANGEYSICSDATASRSDCDWYCFICFKSAPKILKCNGCFRVFHESCCASSDEKGKCYFCKTYVQEIIRKKELSVENINDVIDVFLYNIKLGFMDVIQASWFQNESQTIKNLIPKLIHNHDFNFIHIKRKMENSEYRSIFEFIFDCKTVCFNITVLYGVDSQIGKRCDDLYAFMGSQDRFIHNCVDCYIRFYHKKEGDKYFWFIVPCDPPHQLCFARAEGYSHYPAKIIRSDLNESFVWFFDEYHEYATVSNRDICSALPRDTVITPQLAKALQEFGMHKLLLECQVSGTKFNLHGFKLRESPKKSKKKHK
ncbi:zinc finger MYND domain-containing protein 11-like protein [Dinothrombium tinctorium]|uniref:Zinc finger MYND domain-containing protein 11-like protein n=1 Tax=Dinothrombium tinctorium TaxID=1965070 RepID=A0A3S3S7K4_9ACAR|nr:zinc finger MYND domain-containing protein 11-like protein [Dinothrombium tinctorium]